jgi:hypothetical protein
MAQWEPLADRIPVDMRRLATQLRRMKDRSGLTVPALAARTARSAESWEKYLHGRQLPPLDAVETLAQASGADYDRIGALWRLAEKAAAGTGDRGRGKPVPHPDPLDPLGAEEGLPRRRRRALLWGMAAVLAVGALLTVLFAAGPSTGRAPAPDAGPTASARPGTPLTPGAKGTAPRTSPGSGAPRGGSGGPTAEPSVTPMLGGGAPSPSSGAPGTPGTPAPRGTGPAGASLPADPASHAPTTTPAAPPSGTVSPTATAPPTATPGPSQSGLCLGLIVLNVCLAGRG